MNNVEPRPHDAGAVDEGRGFHGLLADLSGLQHSIVNPDSFVDPSILEVNWGMVSEPDGRGGLRWVEGGVITLADGSTRKFFEFDLLKPYVAAWEARREEIARKQAEYDAESKLA